MSKKFKKGKTMALIDFLAAEPKIVTVRDSTWAAIVAEAEEKSPIIVDMSGLPTAPRSAVDIDLSNLPDNPPFRVHIANLSFETNDEGLRRIFADLQPKSARVMRDGTRSRGCGLVEFKTRENLIEALKRTDREVYGRRIIVKISDKADIQQSDDNRTNFGSRPHRMGNERPEMANRWQRIERKSNELSDDRQGASGYYRDRPNRDNVERSNFSADFRNGQRGGSYGYGYSRRRDDGTTNNRDYNRQEPNQRYNNDNSRQNRNFDRSSYTVRDDDTRDRVHRNSTNDDNQETLRERPRLQLQPRTKPFSKPQPASNSSSSVNNASGTSSITSTEDSHATNENLTNISGSSEHQVSNNTSEVVPLLETSNVKPSAPSRGSGSSVFGSAKPVDTAAKELEIEKKLEELQMINSEAGDHYSERGPSSRSSQFRDKRPSNQDDQRNRDRRDDVHGRRFENNREKSNYDNHYFRDRDRYNNAFRRNNDSERTGKYNHHGRSDQDNDRYNYQHRDREINEPNNHRRSSNDGFYAQPQSGNQPRTILRRTVQTEDNPTRVQLSNKFGMLDDDNLDDNDHAQSSIID